MKNKKNIIFKFFTINNCWITKYLCLIKMGIVISELTPIIETICPCKSCAKYVCNACKFRSECFDCCDLEIETTEIQCDDDDEIVQ